MKKINLLKSALILFFVLCNFSQVWATSATVGITTTTSTTSGATGTARTTSGATNLTVTHQLNSGVSGAIAEYSSGDKAMYYASTTAIYSKGAYKWNKNTSDTEILTANNYIGYSVAVASGYKYSLSNLTFQIAGSCNFTYKLMIYNSSGTAIYTGTETTITNYSKASATNYSQSITLSGNSNLQNLTGTFYVRVYLKFNSTGKYLCFPTFTITGDVAALPACTAPNHVDISGTWDRFGGETIDLTATAYSSAGTGSQIADANITGWQWQKYNGSSWVNVTNGTVDGVVTSGATTKNLKIENCGGGNSGSYRCTVSTGATCSTSSDGYGVKVYVLECYTDGTTTYNFTRDGENQRGSVEVTLAARAAGHEFKIHADNNYYGVTGDIYEDEDDWVFTTSGNNVNVHPGLGGTFTFTIDYSSDADQPVLGVTYPRKTVYLVPNSDWISNSAKFAFYYFGSGGGTGWTSFLSASVCDAAVYPAEIPQWDGVTIIGVRFNSSEASPGWNGDGHVWNQTQDLTLSSYDKVVISDWNSATYNSNYAAPTYTITFAANGGSGSMSNISSIACDADKTITANAYSKTGYSFAGWKANVDVKINGSTVSAGTVIADKATIQNIRSNITLTAQWSVNSYNLTWNLGGGTTTSAGTGIASGVSVNTTSSVAYGTSLTAPTVTKNYYTFSAWSPAVASTMPAAATTYTATWTANKYNVSTSLTNMSVSSGTTGTNAATYGTDYSLTLAATGDYVLPTTITVTIGGSAAPSGSYSYNYSTGVVTITGSYITGNIVITAAGEENVFRVTYSGNGNTGGTVPSDATAYDPDAEVTVAAGVPTKTNYTFVGWLNSVDNTIYRAGQAFTITAHTTLTAQWQGTVADEDFYWSNYVSSPLSAHTAASLKSKTTATTITISGMSTGTGARATDNATSIVDGTSYNFTSSPVYIKMPSGNSIYFTTTKTSTIKIQYVTNSSSTSGIELRASSSTGTVKGSSSVTDKQLKFQTLTVSNLAAGTYYIVAVNKEINIGAIVVTYAGNKTGFDVTFDKNGKTAAAGMPANYSGVPSGKKIAEPTEIPTVSNFIFDGWVTTSGGSTAFDFANTTITTNKTIYAKWVAKTAPTTSYTFTLSATCTSASPTATLSGSQSGWSYQLYKDGVASGDPKAGTGSALTWTSLGAGTYLVKTVETSMQASAQIGSSATVYASTSITSNLASSRPVNANVSTTVSITATGASPTYQWYTCNSDGTGKVAIEGKTTNSLSYTFTNADAPTKYICCVVTGTCGAVTSNIQTVTITPTYLLTYDANGGSGAPAAAYRPATTAALSSTQPTRSNYAFEGWNTKSNGSGTRYAAGASFPMPAQATTLYAEWVETATLTWTLNVNTAESSIGTESKASTNARISNTTGMTNLANYGSLEITSSAKSGLTSKIGTPASYDANKYMYVTFTVPAGYEFVPTSISVYAQPVSTNKDVKLILTDGANTITKTQTNLSQGTTTTVTETNSAKTAFKGTVTLKIYCYGATDAYRLGTPITVSGKVRPVTLTYVGGSGSNWNTTTNWSPACIPTIDHDVVIEVPVDVNITNARAKSVVIYNNGSTKTGQLILDAGKELVVSRTVRKTTDGSSYTATGENDIVFNSTSVAGLGALVMGSHDGTNKATVNFTTRSAGVKDDNTSIAQYVGTPFNDENNILHNWYNSWIYGITYDGSRNIGWERVEEGSGMTPFKGYCVFSADGANHVYWEQGTLNASTDQTISGLNWQSGTGSANLNNENLLANSWTAPIYIKAMESSDFVNADATIYIFNSTSASAYESDGFGGNYDSYTVNTANAVIPAMQSFSVFTTGSGASVTLDYNKIVYEPAVAGTATPAANKAPRRERKTEAEANKLRLFVRTENGLGDMLYMWEREDFSEAFENGWDGRKMYGENYAPQLFAITPDGAMAVNCVPTYEGVLIGFRAGTDELAYTFSFEYDDDAEPLYLYDLYADTYTRVLNGNTYLFVANDYDTHARFSLTRRLPGVATGTEDVSQPTSGVRKVLFNDHIYILRDGRLYDVTGKTVK